MRHNIATVLICCREAINLQYPAKLYPPFTRTAETIKFLHGAAEGLRVYERRNEAGIIDDIIAGIKRDGLAHLDAKIREAENMRMAVSAKVESECRHLRKSTHPATRDIWICLDCGINQDGEYDTPRTS